MSEIMSLCKCLMILPADPATGLSGLPDLHRFLALCTLKLDSLGCRAETKEEDIKLLSSALGTWNSSAPSQVLAVGVHANAGEQTKVEMMNFVHRVGEMVDQKCSSELSIPLCALCAEGSAC